MQSNKTSKKTRKAADAAANPESNAAEVTTKPRASRSSKSKVQETNEVASASHRHKIVSPVSEGIVEPTSVPAEIREADSMTMTAAAGSTPSRIVDPAEVANLAYSYFVARGYQHGFAEEDWFRAERELQSAHSV